MSPESILAYLAPLLTNQVKNIATDALAISCCSTHSFLLPFENISHQPVLTCHLIFPSKLKQDGRILPSPTLLASITKGTTY